MSVYNAQRYLAEAVDSVLGQSWADFELIVIDDGSTDGSLDLLHGYRRTDRRVRVVSHANTGLTRALQEGVDLATGRFVARMDADDIADPARFERQRAFLDRHPAHVAVGCQLLLIDPDGEPLAEQNVPTGHEAIERLLLRGNGVLPHPAAMIRAAALASAGGYRAAFPCAQDLDLWLRLAEIGRLANLDEVLLRYRLHLQSVTARRRALQLACAERAVREAFVRRGRPASDEFDLARSAADSVAKTHRGWARMALRAGNYQTAHKHARRALACAPLDPSNWHLVLRASVLRALGRGRRGPSSGLAEAHRRAA